MSDTCSWLNWQSLLGGPVGRVGVGGRGEGARAAEPPPPPIPPLSSPRPASGPPGEVRVWAATARAPLDSLLATSLEASLVSQAQSRENSR